jgi:subtilisin family serine protease
MGCVALRGPLGPRRNSVGLLSVALCAAAALGLSAPASAAGEHVPGRLILRLRPGVSPEREAQILASVGAVRKDRIAEIDVQRIELPPGTDEDLSAQTLFGWPEVRSAELERLVPLAGVTANDPLFTNQSQTLAQIQVPAAWSMTTGSSAVKIAIVDTGVDGNHADLAPNLIGGWNFVENNSNTNDVDGHGTHAAGVAAAAGNNSLGIAGVAWSVKIMPIRVDVSFGQASLFDIADGLVWAADHGARVAAVGFFVGDTAGSAVSTAAEYFQSRGGVVTAPAGNGGQSLSLANDPYFLTVSGITTANALASQSNKGTHVDLAAPWQLWGTGFGGIYQMWSGTSWSAAAVAGVAALTVSADPTLTGSELRDLLTQSADDLGTAGWDSSFGWGRVNAERAVATALGSGGGGGSGGDTQPPSTEITSPKDQAVVKTNLTVKAAAVDNVGVTKVEFYLDGALLGADTSRPYACGWAAKSAAKGPHTLQCKAYDAAGNVGTSPVVTVYR